MGIPQEASFVCLIIRDAGYLNAMQPSNNWDYHDYRDVEIDNFVLQATAPRDKPLLAEYPLSGSDPQSAETGSRPVYWLPDGFQSSIIYDWGKLLPGNIVNGPAIIEAPFTTIAVPPHAIYAVDNKLTGILSLPSKSS